MKQSSTNKFSFLQTYGAMLILPLVLLLLAPLLIYQTVRLTRAAVLDEIHDTSAHTLNLVTGNLSGELARFQALPHLLASDPIYRKLWDEDKSPVDIQRINLLLEKNKNITGALDLYIMDQGGLTLAASNWQSERTFIGRNFSFRPYFQDAINGSLGRYFALGSTSGERGYYFSYPIRLHNRILGVMVCKIQVGQFEEAWQSRQHEIVVTDKNGVIFLSSKQNWLFKSLSRLSRAEQKQVGANRQYGGVEIAPLGIRERDRLYAGASLITLSKRFGNRAYGDTAQPANASRRRNVAMQSTEYLQISRDMTAAGWRVHILARTDAVKTEVWRNALGVSALLFSLLIGTALLGERIRRTRERIMLQKRARAELEQRVEERTLELQQTQSELIQAGKLAVLGKMSAGLSHELNQPLAAIRSYSDNATTFLARGQVEPASANLQNIAELTDRMARIIKNLRTFARKDKVEAGPTDLCAATSEAFALVNHRVDADSVKIVNQLPPGPILVYGGQVRLQQVIVNILSNALDAVALSATREIRLEMLEEPNHWALVISDTGPGLTQEQLERVFDPFYTTKEVGEGVGLGLSISYGIIEQFGGRIDIDNHPQGGAVFKVRLLKAEQADQKERQQMPVMQQ